MKKFLLSSALLSLVMLSPQCLANTAKPNQAPLEISKASLITTADKAEEIEVVLWQELTIYLLIVSIYVTWWLRQKV